MRSAPPQIPTEEIAAIPDVLAWQNLRDHFKERLAFIRQVRASDGIEAARLEQDNILKGTEDRNAWEQMFAQGAIRNIKNSAIVREAFDALCDLSIPIITLDEEGLIALEYILDTLIKNLQQVHEKIRAGCRSREDFGPNINLMQACDDLSAYDDLARNNLEARQMREQIKAILLDLNQKTRRHSK